jgi:hypothetical protein
MKVLRKHRADFKLLGKRRSEIKLLGKSGPSSRRRKGRYPSYFMVNAIAIPCAIDSTRIFQWHNGSRSPGLAALSAITDAPAPLPL